MSSIKDTEMFNYYDPTEGVETKQLPLGEYPAHIESVDIREAPVKGEYRARIYNYWVKIAPSAAERTYRIEDITGEQISVSGKSFIGRRVRANGVFYFLNPTSEDSFKPNPSGNGKYLLVCRALNVDTPSTELTDKDGNKRTVHVLPDLKEEDFIGKPVFVKLGLSKPFIGKEGDRVTLPEVKFAKRWKDGKVLSEVEDKTTSEGGYDEQIPF